MKNKVFRQKGSVRIVSFILCLLIAFFATPTVIFTEAASTIKELASRGDSWDNDIIDSYTYTGEAYEIEALREENVKHFHLEDGSYIAAQYNYPVHYVDDEGVMQDIDNQLSEASGGVFANKNARIKFAKKITGNETLFALHDGNTKLTLSLKNATKGVKGTVTNNDDAEETTQLQKMMKLEKLSSSIIYKDILTGVDLEYIAHSNNIKENIIVKEKSDAYSYSFELKLNGLSAELLENGDIRVVNEKTKEVQYVIPAPVVFDSNKEYAPVESSYYTLEKQSGGKYLLGVTVSSEWMNDEARAFPVTVDPAITASNSYVQDTSVYSAQNNTSYADITYLYVTDDRLAHWKTTSLPTIPSSAYITNATLTMYATTARGDDDNLPFVAAHEVLTDWSESLTWNQYTDSTNPKGKFDDRVIDYNVVRDGFYSWNITSLVEKWYSGTNYGVAFDMLKGDPLGAVFCSSESITASNRPALTVTYKDMKGTEAYWSYSSHAAGVAGMGSVNLSTGQLSFAIPTLSTTDSLMPYAPTLVYNSSMSNEYYTYPYAETANTNQYMPCGFKLNICETVIKKSFTDNTGETKYYYVYADPDGTEHGFYVSADNSLVYTDEDGMQKTLSVQGDGSVEITDDTKWIRTFTQKTSNPSEAVLGAWYLTKITDESGNSVIFTYDSSLRPTKVSVKPNGIAQIDFLDLYYYSTGKLRMIYNEATKDAVVFRYSSTYSGSISTVSPKYLRQIDYARGSNNVSLTNWSNFAFSENNLTNITVDAAAKYEYDSSGNITYAIDTLSGQKMSYSWTADKLTGLEHLAGNEEGQSVSYIYGSGYTDVKTSGGDDILNTADDIITRYTFDDEGRSKSVYSYSNDGTEIYGATVGKYETQENIKNNLKEQTVIGGTSVNYLLNGGFEKTQSETSFENWDVSGAVRREYVVSSGDGYYNAKIEPLSGTTASLTQYVSLKEGDYTLSMLYKSVVSEGVTGTVSITSTAGSYLRHTEEISLNPTYATGIETVFSTSFRVSDHINGGDKLKITIKFTTDSNVSVTPTITIKEVVLSNSIGASDYSLVSYGSFEESCLNSAGAATPLSSYWKTEEDTAPTVASGDTPFGNSVKVTGEIDGEKYVKQRIYQISNDELSSYDRGYEFNTNAYHEYIVSGFAFSEEASYSPNAYFRIRIDVLYYQGAGEDDVVISHYFDFTPASSGWQFAGGSFSMEYKKSATDNNVYDCVRAIDLYCEYSYQPNGYALFDNISVVNATGLDVERYYYYSEGNENGLLAYKENRFYTEYYEYDDNRNLSRVANNRGELTDYYYTESNKIDYTVDYDFECNGHGYYPFNYEDPDAAITKYPKTKTNYNYNSYGLLTSVCTYIIRDDLTVNTELPTVYTQYTYNTSEGSKIFGALSSEIDASGVQILYCYDSTNGRLLATTNADAGTGTSYSYDERGNLVSVLPVTCQSYLYTPITNEESVSYTYNSNNLLSSISTESTTYSFSYDVFGNPTAVNIGEENTVVSYWYYEHNGKLGSVTYGNGDAIDYSYNDLDLLTEVWYTADGCDSYLTYEYEYTDDGQVHKFTDHTNFKSTVYKYDQNNRLIGFVEYDYDYNSHEFSSDISYNDRGLLWGVSYDVNYLNGTAEDSFGWSYIHLYDDSKKRLDSVSISASSTDGNEYYYYDEYDRVSGKLYSLPSVSNSSVRFENRIDYTYEEYSGRLWLNTSGRITSYTSTVNDNESAAVTYTFTYDGNGNITKILYSTGEEIRYLYDNLGQLLREDNEFLDVTYVYTYDNAGNILKKEEYEITSAGETPTILISTDTYSYNYYDDEWCYFEWGDLLSHYNGHEITYDEIGNPLSYYNGDSYEFSWDCKDLYQAVKDGKIYYFTYNDAGIRTSKYTNGKTTTYYVSGSQIAAEKTNENITVYIYDAEGLPLGMRYHGANYAEDVWDVYWFERNIFGDIVAVYDEAGTKLISYRYDAYGNCSYVYYNGGNSTSAVNNPFRYRGYFYDTDLELYYLNSRYYDCNTGRFISAADVSSLNPSSINGLNLYTYASSKTGSYSPNQASKRTVPIISSSSSLEYRSVVYSIATIGESTNKTSTNPWSFAVGLVTPEKYSLPSRMYAYVLYAKGTLGWGYTFGDGYSLASFSAGVLDVTFHSPKLFDSLSDSHLANPNIYLGLGTYNVNASAGVGFSGTAEIMSGTVGIQFGDAVSVEAKGYVGIGITLDFTDGIRFGVGLGLGFEISLNVDWYELFR